LLFIAFYHFSFAPFFPERFRWEMVSRKIKGFHISESRQKSRSTERIKWMMIGALNGHSETGSETEQVGSGMNGRRRS
jgi:hypothetical protein